MWREEIYLYRKVGSQFTILLIAELQTWRSTELDLADRTFSSNFAQSREQHFLEWQLGIGFGCSNDLSVQKNRSHTSRTPTSQALANILKLSYYHKTQRVTILAQAHISSAILPHKARSVLAHHKQYFCSYQQIGQSSLLSLIRQHLGLHH
jgi:hypothetical protein